VRRRVEALVMTALVAFACAAAGEPPAPPVGVHVEVGDVEATVGDRLDVRYVVTTGPATRFDPPQLGPALGPFSVVDGSWSGAEDVEGGRRWTWTGAVVSFRPGDFELPALRIRVEDDAGARHEVLGEPVAISIHSVLDTGEGGGEAADIADLKPPAGVPPDYGALVTAMGILAVLLLGAGLLWWLHRRYAARLAAVPAPEDPFHRTPPHEWVYAELQKLLERRLAEQGQVALFFAELSRILKRYLGGRYRVELMERTTAEVAPHLRQAGAPGEATQAVGEMLACCDRVKFARYLPGSDECRTAIESAYAIVDATKPQPTGADAGAA
jgi:hypothetical protein